MNKKTFDITMKWLEEELKRDGMTLNQIESCEIDALRITDINTEPVVYIQTVSRLAASGLY